jgi:AraC-like DNA-binding protein
MTPERSPATFWSLSEFLNLVELRSQCWCFVELGRAGGFALPHNEMILFYAVLKGTAKLTDTNSGDTPLPTGDIVMILSGDAHALRGENGGPTKALDFLHKGEYVDVPPTFNSSRGRVTTRLLCGRLKVRWPGGQRPKSLPPILRIKASEGIINFQSLEISATRSGAAAVLTRSALALFLYAFRNHPECEQIFNESSLHDPISRAQQFMETHPFADWTVARLASKVGLGRSKFAALFVAKVGKTPMQFLGEKQMRYTAHLLEKTDLKISEISERVGYRSVAAFTRRCIAYFGQSPGKMRRAMTARLGPTAGSTDPTVQRVTPA